MLYLLLSKFETICNINMWITYTLSPTGQRLKEQKHIHVFPRIRTQNPKGKKPKSYRCTTVNFHVIIENIFYIIILLIVSVSHSKKVNFYVFLKNNLQPIRKDIFSLYLHYCLFKTFKCIISI